MSTHARRGTRYLARITAVLIVGLAGSLALGEVPAAPIEFQSFSPPTLRRALADDRLILLVLDSPWSDASHRARHELWSDPEIAAAIRDGYIPIRERADLRPDLVRRYPAEGWPAMTILLPDGSPLFFVDDKGEAGQRVTSGFRPAKAIAAWLRNAREFYQVRREGAIRVARERMAIMSETVVPTAGEMGNDRAWALAQLLRNTFDRESRYFGGAPRVPRFDLIETMLLFGHRGQSEWRVIGLAALDTLDRKLVDRESGALYRLALGPDWEEPQRERLLDRNARYLDLLATAYRVSAKRTYRDRGAAVAAFLSERLGQEDGSFAAGLCDACPEGIDRTVVAGDVALAGAALVRAGAAFGDTALIDRGLRGIAFVAKERHRPERGVARTLLGDAPVLERELEDLTETAWAFTTAYEVTGDRAWIDRAQDVARVALSRLRDPTTGALRDSDVQPTGAPPLRVPLFPLDDNARMARVLLRLSVITGLPLYRDAASGIVRAFAGSPDQVPLWTASYTLAAHDLVFEPWVAEISGRAGDAAARELAIHALGSDLPLSMIRWVDAPLSAPASLKARAGQFESRAVTDPGEVRAALAYARAESEGRIAVPEKEELRPKWARPER